MKLIKNSITRQPMLIKAIFLKVAYCFQCRSFPTTMVTKISDSVARKKRNNLLQQLFFGFITSNMGKGGNEILLHVLSTKFSPPSKQLKIYMYSTIGKS